MDSKKFWDFLMLNCIVLWFVLLLLGFYRYPEDTVMSISYVTILLVVHIFEISISYKIGVNRNLSPLRVIVKTVIFGFTWWVPLKKEVIDK